ncbi:MAG: hypothetical protein JNM71_15640 [Flavobacterium lindanitolerans]|nr:hypothetical protein [Flavobacterium lindanitolerans]HAT3994797.1 hypothetical protein [Elizabethkingia anophelis]
MFALMLNIVRNIHYIRQIFTKPHFLKPKTEVRQ